MRLLVLLALLFTTVLFTGCRQTPNLDPNQINYSSDRSRELMVLAAQEAGLIKDLPARLTRQLNIAHLQITHGQAADGILTLHQSVTTLETPAAAQALSAHIRISGWVSVSELSRQAGDRTLALKACTQAVAALKALPSPAERCQFVMGVANEMNHILGVAEAAALLEDGGKWARDIHPLEDKRRAITAFAVALFNIDYYDAGLRALQNDDDPAWRSDKLLELAQRPQPVDYDRLMSIKSVDYGQQVDFQSVFKGSSKPRTQQQSK